MKINSIDDVKKSLNIALEVIEKQDYNSIDEIKNIFIEKIKENEMKNWQVLWPIRISLSWEQFSPWAFELIYILWKNLSSQRIKKVLKEL